MADVTATQITLDSSLEQFKEQFNNLQSDVSGITLTSLGGGNSLVFEGSTADDNETTLSVVDPTGDRTVLLPNASTTLVGTDTTDTLTNKTLTTPTITTPVVNAGLQLKNGATSAGFLEFFEDSDNGTNKVTLIGPASTADVTITLPSSAGTLALSGSNITVADGGTIGSASDTDAISISSGGVVALSATTANTNASDGALTVAGGLGVALDASIGDDLRMISDAAVVSFGANSEITLTHVHDTGLNLKHTATGDDKPIILTLQTGETDIAANDVIGAINFQAPDEASATGDNKLVAAGIEAVSEGDFSNTSNATKLSFKTGASEAAAEKMSLSSAGLLTIADDLIIKDGGTIGATSATTAITIASTGIVSFVDDITIKDGGTIGSASGPTAMTIDASGNVTFAANLTVNGSTVTNSATNTVIEDQLIELGNGRTGSASGDAGIVIERGDDANVFIGYDESADRILFGTGSFTGASTGDLTVTTAGVTAGSLIIDDAGTIGSASDTDAIAISSGGVVSISATTANTNATDGALTVAGGVGIALDASIGDDLRMISDSSVISFGTNSEITLTHIHNSGIALKHTATADDQPIAFVLQTGETDIAADDVIGRIEFQAPDEGTGTDAVAVAAGISAISEGDFSASNNATKLSFRTAVSEAAVEKMTLSSRGALKAESGKAEFGGDFIVMNSTDGTADAGDNIIIEDGGTDGSGTNAGDNMLYEYYTSFTNSQLLIKDTEGNILKAIYGVGGDGET